MFFMAFILSLMDGQLDAMSWTLLGFHFLIESTLLGDC